jgi:hypothetical protein
VTVGFVISGPDNKSFMLDDALDYPRCPVCGWLTDPDWVNAGFAITLDVWDVSFTYENYCLVSERFREIAPDGGQYVPLPRSPGFYVLQSSEVREFDSERRGTRFENRCSACDRWAAVAGAAPAFLRDPTPLPDRIIRTDIEFGSGNEKHPLLLVGVELGQRLRDNRLAGLDLKPVSPGSADSA